MASAGYERWILKAPNQRAPSANVKLRIFCFPPAGTGAWAFHGWGNALPAAVEVLPIELPGRNSRVGEPPHQTMQSLVDAVIEAIMPLLREKPFVLFGHSMGAWVVYEVTLALMRRGAPLPVKVYVSGARAPHLNDVDPTRLGDLPFKEFWPAFEGRYGKVPELEDEFIKEYVFPVLQTDFRLLESYKPSAKVVSEGGGLPCPLSALCGEGDNRVGKEQLGGWKSHSQSPIQEIWFPECDHRYISDNADKLLQFLSTDLAKLL